MLFPIASVNPEKVFSLGKNGEKEGDKQQIYFEEKGEKTLFS